MRNGTLFKDYYNMQFINPFILGNGIPTDGLVAYYQFNGNANDESGNGNDGSITGCSFVTGRKGDSSGAINFPGSDGNTVEVTSSDLNFNSDWAVSVWVYPNNSVSGSDFIIGNDFAGGWACALFQNAAARFFIDGNGVGDIITSSNSKVTVGEWTHIVFNYEASTKTANFYFNSNFDTSGVSNDFRNSGGNLVIIGIDPRTGAGLNLNARLDDLIIYNKLLTPSEITALYNE
jgi:hypothetical protein